MGKNAANFSDTILSDDPDNERLAETMMDVKMFMTGATSDGPRFGLLTTLIRSMPVYAFDAPSLESLGDILTDGTAVLISTAAMKKLMAQEDASKGAAQGVVPAILTGLAAAAGIAVGWEMEDPLHHARIAFQTRSKDSIAIGFDALSVAVVSQAKMKAALSDFASASHVFEHLHSDAALHHNRLEEIVTAINANNAHVLGAHPGPHPVAQPLLAALSEHGRRSGAIVARREPPHLLDPSTQDALSLAQAVGKRIDAREEALAIGAGLPAGRPASAPRV